MPARGRARWLRTSGALASVARDDEADARHAAPLESLPKCVGERQLADGFWRLFSPAYPAGGVTTWNTASTWKQAWGLSEDAFFAFGEDLFGNQLVMQISGVSSPDSIPEQRWSSSRLLADARPWLICLRQQLIGKNPQLMRKTDNS